MLNFVEEFKPAQTVTPVAYGTPSDMPDLDQSLSSFTSRSGGLVLLFSDLLSPTWEKALTRLAGRSSEVVVLHTLSPQELRPTLGGDVRLIDRESGAAVIGDPQQRRDPLVRPATGRVAPHDRVVLCAARHGVRAHRHGSPD